MLPYAQPRARPTRGTSAMTDDAYFAKHYRSVCLATYGAWLETLAAAGVAETELDPEREMIKSVADAVTNTYMEGIDPEQWRTDALARLAGSK